VASTLQITVPGTRPGVPQGSRKARIALRVTALAYLVFLLVLPVGIVCWRTFAHGVAPVWDALTEPNAIHAFKLTMQVAVIAVGCNTVFGVAAAILVVRHDFPGKRLFNAFIDLPMAVSPVVIGLALILVYGENAPFGEALARYGIEVIFSRPGMVMATIFVGLPLVVRAVAPVLEEIGTDQEQAARTLGAGPVQTFRRVTLPSIRWALAYGVVLCLARSIGEFGAVAVVSGRVVGETQTATLYVAERFESFDLTGAYAASFVLAMIAVVVLVAINLIRPNDS
jgi:sulfate/thiosulfate transport system permease protein